jgi:Tfp pilus assembly protein PilO
MKNAPVVPIYKRQPIALGCALATVLLIGAAYFRSSELPDRQQVLEQRSAEGQRIQNNVTNATLLKEQYDALVSANHKIDELLISPSQLGENLQFFYKIETATNTKISDLRQVYTASAKTSAAARVVPVPYSLVVRGEYRAILNFVRRIEKSTRLSRVMGASLQQEGNQDSSALAGRDVTLNLSVELLGTP